MGTEKHTVLDFYFFFSCLVVIRWFILLQTHWGQSDSLDFNGHILDSNPSGSSKASLLNASASSTQSHVPFVNNSVSFDICHFEYVHSLTTLKNKTVTSYKWRCIYCIYVPCDMVHKILHWPSNKIPSKYWGFDFLDVSGKYPPGNFENWLRKFRQMRSRPRRGWDQRSLTSWMRMMKSIQRRRIYIDEKFWKVCISFQCLKCFTGWQFLSSEVLKENQIIKKYLHDLSYF